MAGILDIPDRLTSDLDVLSIRNCDCKTRDHTAEDIKSCRTIFYDCSTYFMLSDRVRECSGILHSTFPGLLINPFYVRAPSPDPTPDNPI